MQANVSEIMQECTDASDQERISFPEVVMKLSQVGVERIAQAGCVGYMVSLAGRRAVYYGRTGDCYVEPFPAAA